MGNAINRGRLAWAVIVLTVTAAPAWPRERFAVIISGAAGGSKYADSYAEWRTTLAAALKDKRGLKEENVIVLSEDAVSDGNRSTSDGVKRPEHTRRAANSTAWGLSRTSCIARIHSFKPLPPMCEVLGFRRSS